MKITDIRLTTVLQKKVTQKRGKEKHQVFLTFFTLREHSTPLNH